jgi:hypothetical protein
MTSPFAGLFVWYTLKTYIPITVVSVPQHNRRKLLIRANKNSTTLLTKMGQRLQNTIFTVLKRRRKNMTIRYTRSAFFFSIVTKHLFKKACAYSSHDRSLVALTRDLNLPRIKKKATRELTFAVRRHAFTL